ncbi:DUF320 domain-containing protein [Streptomyces sp. MBT58]|uniref:chaplin family protein n=1 Tax=Streptomyces sp. MBT58 TaxID=1488389 RepID=UPI001912F926|nr:chaplin family protein [Streptomyces sp. MBT58]MBK5992930.1 DUF320 domain-containing protein [Streptomyces sp. MBT58]
MVVVSGGVFVAVGGSASGAGALPVPLPVQLPAPVTQLLHVVPVMVPAVATIASPAADNTCVISSRGAYSTGKTVHGSGTLGGNALQMPTDNPRNECGNVGLVCKDCCAG